MADPNAPKFDIKMLAMPALFMLSRQFDMKDPEVVKMLRIVFVSIFGLLIAVYAWVYNLMASNTKKNKIKIWVPPKPQPKLPFGLGPPEEAVKASDYKVTTYGEHEFDLIKSEVTAMLMSLAITLVMSFKFDVHLSLLMQSVMTPLNAFDSLVLKKYLIGIEKLADGSNLYKETLEDPVEAEKISGTNPFFKRGEPRVEELPDEEPKPEKKAKKLDKPSSSSSKSKTTSTPASELD